MTVQVQHTPRTADTPPALAVSPRTLAQIREQRPSLPSPSDEQAWTGAVVVDIGGVEPCTRAQLVATYGTADPDWLAAHFALDIDVEAARRYAAEDRQVAA